MRFLGNKGVTLIELLIAIFVSTLLMAGIYSVFMAQLRVGNIQEQSSTVQQNIRAAMYIMEREIRMAGYRGKVESASSGTGFSVATVNSMTFAYVKENDDIDNDGDGTKDQQGEVSTISYAMYDSDLDGENDDLGRVVDNALTASPIAENIEEIEFLYNEGMTTQHTAPPNPGLIETVTITILARSTSSVTDTETGRVYNTPAGDTWGDDENYNDGFYRRYITSRIICRNLTSN